jgi:hypothetical protein
MEQPERDGVCMPHIQSDIEDYRSPIDGGVITSRSQQRYDLEKNDCVLQEPRRKPRGYINPRFAAKHGLPLREDWQEVQATNDAKARPAPPKDD